MLKWYSRLHTEHNLDPVEYNNRQCPDLVQHAAGKLVLSKINFVIIFASKVMIFRWFIVTREMTQF